VSQSFDCGSVKRAFIYLPHVQISPILVAAMPGPGLVALGWQLMPSYPGRGALILFIGCFVVLYEIIKEPLLIKRPWWNQIALIGIWLIAFDFLVIDTFPVVKMDVLAHVLPESTPEHVLAGIEWHRQFAELRFALHNSNDRDYEGMRFVLRPNTAVFKAGILGESHGCELEVNPGGPDIFVGVLKNKGLDAFDLSNEFGDLKVRDTLGNESIRIATLAGFVLRCRSLPRDSTIKIVFAGVKLKPDILAAISHGRVPALRHGQFGGSVSLLNTPLNSNADIFAQTLDAAPCPSTIDADGSYKYELWNHSYKQTLNVEGCN
jgi:hypothetical protein